ncbi:MAG: 2-oxoglutarate and iron-dependent oxygenase domain-containing protein, partial [Myxococcota bacterium]
MSDAGVPVLDMARFAATRDDPDFVAQLDTALRTWGFVGLVGHGIGDDVVARCERATQALFALPEAVKQRHETPDDGRQRGYTGLGVEHAKDAVTADLKEFWHVGRDDTDGLPPNRFPDEVPTLASAARDLFAALDDLALTALDAIARGLSLEADYFTSRVAGGNIVLRLIHYPPVGPGTPDGA